MAQVGGVTGAGRGAWLAGCLVPPVPTQVWAVDDVVPVGPFRCAEPAAFWPAMPHPDLRHPPQVPLYYHMLTDIQDAARRFGAPNLELGLGFGDLPIPEPVGAVEEGGDEAAGFPQRMCPLLAYAKVKEHLALLVPSGEFFWKQVGLGRWVARRRAAGSELARRPACHPAAAGPRGQRCQCRPAPAARSMTSMCSACWRTAGPSGRTRSSAQSAGGLAQPCPCLLCIDAGRPVCKPPGCAGVPSYLPPRARRRRWTLFDRGIPQRDRCAAVRPTGLHRRALCAVGGSRHFTTARWAGPGPPQLEQAPKRGCCPSWPQVWSDHAQVAPALRRPKQGAQLHAHQLHGRQHRRGLHAAQQAAGLPLHLFD